MSDYKICTNYLTETDNLQLPIDVIIHILSYLSTSDRISAGLVNQTWHEASLARKFLDQEELVLGRHHADNLNQVFQVLRHSTRPFYHFVFREVELKRDMPIWDQYGPQMKSLVLYRCDLSEKTLVEIFKHLKSLRTLRINSCRECLMSGRLLEEENDVKELARTFENVRELSLAHNRFLSDALFNRLVAVCPNLESFSLTGCQMSFHCGLYKKFYPDDAASCGDASKSILTFANTLRYLKRQASKLKHLNFGYTLIDGTALAALSALPDLRLESLTLQACYQLTIEGIRGLTQYQSQLKVLDLSFCVRITDVSLLHVCKNLTRLETLKIKRCRAVTDNGVRYIRLLKNLRELDISEDEQLTADCITRGICSSRESVDASQRHVDPGTENVNHDLNVDADWSADDETRKGNMRILSVNALHLHEESVESISKSFPNLRRLELSHCFNGVTDKTIQMIFKELVHLQTLKISHCDEVSDAGLTGMGAGNNHEYVEKIRVVHKPEFTESRLRISLRSKAEEEIVRDADRKREIMRLCENVSNTTFSGFSLIRLKGLRELDLSGCNRITDVSLKHAFAFTELRILNLSQCQQITHVGLDYLSRNNPAIEYLDLNRCYNISDIGISYLAQRLHRLKQLLIQGCLQLTDHTLDSIKLYCKSLRYLDTRFCRGMTAAGVESLTNLYVDWHKQSEDIVSPESAPPLPPLPSLP